VSNTPGLVAYTPTTMSEYDWVDFVTVRSSSIEMTSTSPGSYCTMDPSTSNTSAISAPPLNVPPLKNPTPAALILATFAIGLPARNTARSLGCPCDSTTMTSTVELPCPATTSELPFP